MLPDPPSSSPAHHSPHDPGFSAQASLSDGLVAQAAAGAAAAVDALLRHVSGRVRLMVLARLGGGPPSTVSVEELCQSILIAFADGLPSLRNQTAGGALAFLSTIASRQVAAAISHREARPGVGSGPRRRDRAEPTQLSLDAEVFDGIASAPLGELIATGDTTPFSAVVRADQRVRLLQAIARLKPEHRSIVTLLAIDGLDTAEAARILGISREAAAMRFHRAVEILRERLGEPPSGAHPAPQSP